jgi:hypothetical protein
MGKVNLQYMDEGHDSSRKPSGNVNQIWYVPKHTRKEAVWKQSRNVKGRIVLEVLLKPI